MRAYVHTSCSKRAPLLCSHTTKLSSSRWRDIADAAARDPNDVSPTKRASLATTRITTTSDLGVAARVGAFPGGGELVHTGGVPAGALDAGARENGGAFLPVPLVPFVRRGARVKRTVAATSYSRRSSLMKRLGPAKSSDRLRRERGSTCLLCVARGISTH